MTGIKWVLVIFKCLTFVVAVCQLFYSSSMVLEF
jgi:hypothetical protein